MNSYLIYDPALNGAYTQLILQQEYPVHASLFAGTKDEGLDDVAPYIFQIDTQFVQKVIQKPCIELKAISIVQAQGSLESINAHFRPFIYQKLKGREFYFRFWDARVLLKFLPTCDKEQIKTFFEELQAVLIVDEVNKGDAIRFSHDHGRLQTSRIPLSTVWGEEAILMATEAAFHSSEKEPDAQQPKKPRRTFLS